MFVVNFFILFLKFLFLEIRKSLSKFVKREKGIKKFKSYFKLNWLMIVFIIWLFNWFEV